MDIGNGSRKQTGQPARSARLAGEQGDRRGTVISDQMSLHMAAEFETAALEVRAVVSDVRARLMELVDQQLRDAFENALGAAFAMPATQTRPHEESAPPSVGRAAPPPPEPRVSMNIQPDKLPSVQEFKERKTFGGANEATALQESVPQGVVEEIISETEEAVHPGEEEVFKGTVRLNVESNGCIRRVVQFVDDLCQKKEFRLLRLVGNYQKAGVDIWVGLTEPVCLKKMLMKMEGVSEVISPLGYSPNGHERLLNVWLSDTVQEE